MKKTYVAAIAIAMALVIVLAAAVALSQTTATTTTTTQSSRPASGSLAIMGTDPAVAASGVSDASITYSSVMAHQAGSDMASGWTQVSGAGSMDLMASQGTAQTLAASQVRSSSYDAFRFNVDSCKVVYQGQTYIAAVASSTLTAHSQNRVQVNSTTNAAAVVDLRTFIVNAASSSSPQFVFSATAVATSVPPSATASLSLQLGLNVDLSSQAWWNAFMAQTSNNLNVDASLTNGSLALSLTNNGNAAAQVEEVIITPASAQILATGTLPSSLNTSAVFTISGSGSVQQSSSLQASALLSGGSTIASGSTGSLQYSGDIELSSSVASAHVSGIVVGQEYIVTCLGANTYASTTVVAS